MARETNLNMRFDETYEQYYRRIAKVADQRLVRLERLAQQEGYEGASKWAYGSAMYDIEKWSGSGAKRFNTKPPADTNALKAKINDIQEFLQAPTSTKQGIKDVYKRKAESFNKSYGLDIGWEDWAEYLDKYGAKLYDKYGSKTMNMVIQTLRGMKKSDPELTADKLHHMALMRKDGGVKFNYVKVDGTDGSYNMQVDNAMHEIFRKRKDIEEIYNLLVR